MTPTLLAAGLTQSPWALFAGGVVAALVLALVARKLFHAMTVEVEDEETVLVTSFGKLVAKLDEPGLHFVPSRVMPYVKVAPVSQKLDFRHLTDLHVNDSEGTTVMVDLWIEFRIEDPVKAMYEVADWDQSLQNLVAHAATSVLGNRSFRQILCDRSELGRILQQDVSSETKRWGLKVELVFIRKVSLLPEVSRRIFESISARLERARADIAEQGRLAVAKLEADTSVRIARLVAEAKAQYPLGVGRALAELRKEPRIARAYDELYELSLVRPHRTIAFSGFDAGELRAVDAAMLAPALPDENAARAIVPALSGATDNRRPR